VEVDFAEVVLVQTMPGYRHPEKSARPLKNEQTKEVAKLSSNFFLKENKNG